MHCHRVLWKMNRKYAPLLWLSPSALRIYSHSDLWVEAVSRSASLGFRNRKRSSENCAV